MDQLVKQANIEKEDSYDELDRRIVIATQSGLPVVAQPYRQIAEQLGITSQLLMDRLDTMKKR